jgi:hypothetical protein
MIAILVQIMRAEIAAQWEILVDAGWATLMLVGMSVWVWANWPELREEERKQRAGQKQGRAEADRFQGHTLPLTLVQRRFLNAMRKREHN